MGITKTIQVIDMSADDEASDEIVKPLLITARSLPKCCKYLSGRSGVYRVPAGCPHPSGSAGQSDGGSMRCENGSPMVVKTNRPGIITRGGKNGFNFQA